MNAKISKSSDLHSWSEPILVKRRLDMCESTSSSSLHESVVGGQNELVPATVKACTCQRKLKPHSLLGNGEELPSTKRGHRENASLVRQQLQVQLSSSQVQEATAQEYHDTLQQATQRAGDLLLAVKHFVQSLETGHRAASRMRRLAAGLVQTYCVPSEQLNCMLENYEPNNICVELVEACTSIASCLELSNRQSKLLEDHTAKKNDFVTASRNFWHLLESARLSAGQLRRLESQFDAIQAGFQQSRGLLDQELPKLIEKRLKMLSECFSNLHLWLKQVSENNSDLGMLALHFSKILETDLKYTGYTPPPQSLSEYPSKTYSCPLPMRSGQFHTVLYP